MLTARDRDEIRTGRNRQIGAHYARPLFWMSVAPMLVAWIFGIAAVVAVVWGIVHLWNAYVHPYLSSAGPGPFVAVLVGVIVLAFVVRSWIRPRGHYRRRGH
jgi:membrane protein CcdC involved in cytochrome C biogenesis